MAARKQKVKFTITGCKGTVDGVTTYSIQHIETFIEIPEKVMKLMEKEDSYLSKIEMI